MRFNLFLFRKKKKLTQKDMANKLEVSRPHYCDIENGEADPKFSLMEKFEEAFKDEYDDIWELFKKEV